MSSNQDHGNSSRSGSSQQSSEQRNTNPSSDSEKIPRSALEDPNVNVSEEALKGPQGPARNPTPDSAITDEDLLGQFISDSTGLLLLFFILVAGHLSSCG